jgi:hypothetical protein
MMDTKAKAKPQDGSQKLGDRDIEQMNAGGGRVQGEGDYEAARKYDADQAKFNASGKIDKAARDAEKAYEGKEGDELRRAEAEGKKHSHGEDPLLHKQQHR